MKLDPAKMKLHRAFAGLMAAAALLAGPPAWAAPVARTAQVELGDGAIAIPVPAGFGGPTATPALLRDLAAKALPTSNRFVGILLPQDYLDALAAGQPKQRLSRYLLLQTLRREEAAGITTPEFESIREQFRHNADAILLQGKDIAKPNLDRAAKAVGDLTGDKTIAIDAGTMKSLGIFEEQPDAFSMATVQPVTGTSQAGTHKFMQVMAMTIVLIDRKPMLASVYSDYESQADIDWAEGLMHDWLKRVKELNP
jgi:hypothetical protein